MNDEYNEMNNQEPISEPIPEPVSEPVSEPAAEPVFEPASEPAQAYSPAPQASPYSYSYNPHPAQPASPFPELKTAPRKERRHREKSGKLGGRVVALALCCALLGGGMGFGGAMLAGSLNKEETPASKRSWRH